MSVDPFISDPSNGQSLNPYSYVMNNPLKYTDPSGYLSQSARNLLGEMWDSIKWCFTGCGDGAPAHARQSTASDEMTWAVPLESTNTNSFMREILGSAQDRDKSNTGTGSTTNTSGNGLDVIKGAFKGVADGELAAAHYTPMGHPLYSQAGYTNSWADLCECNYQSPFDPVQNNQEQLGRDLSPVLGIAMMLVTRHPSRIDPNDLLSLNKPRQIEASWSGVNPYKHGGEMTAIQHINYRHSFTSGFSNTSKYTKGTSVRNIRSFVNEALKHGKVINNGPGKFKVEYNFGSQIGLDANGSALSSIRILVRDGKIQTAFPI